MICEPLHVAIGDTDLNKERIHAVEKIFGFPQNKLVAPKRVLVGDGILWKNCRRKIKKRRFFLFSDMLLYGDPWPRGNSLKSPHFIDLVDADVISVMDEGGNQKGFSILSPKRSFTVYTSTQEEANQWILHLVRCITESRVMAGRSRSERISHSPVWIPDAEATHCLICKEVHFSVINRRHHCRHCGKVVCNKCSLNKALLAYQGSERVRVCDICFRALHQNHAKLAPAPDVTTPPPMTSPSGKEASTFYWGDGANLLVPTDYDENMHQQNNPADTASAEIHELDADEDIISSTDSEPETKLSTE